MVRSMKPLSHGAISNSQRGGDIAYLRRTIEASSFLGITEGSQGTALGSN